MEAEDGPLLHEFFNDLSDFRTAFGEPGHAAAVSTFLALPEGHDYNSKLLVGIWRNRGLAGARDCIMGYPTESTMVQSAGPWSPGRVQCCCRGAHRRGPPRHPPPTRRRG